MRTFLALAALLSACESAGRGNNFDTADTAQDDAADAAETKTGITVIGPLTWQTETAPSLYNWSDAKAYCADLTLGTFSDWHLPTMEELQGIIDNSAATCPVVVVPLKATTMCAAYWSSTAYWGPPPSAWGVVFDIGVSYYASVSNYGRVRCVR